MDTVTAIAWLVGFVLLTVTVTGLVGRIGFSAPVALVAVGGAVSFIPGIPPVHVEPDLVLYGLLPPLLFAAAIQTSLIDIRARRDSILLLSVGLVAFTVVVVGFATWLLIPAVGLAAAFALAAVVAPTDATAVGAIAGRLGLPRRVVTILQSESLFNDATALVALNVSIAAITASSFNPLTASVDFVLAVVVGVAVGVGTGLLSSFVRSRVHAPVLDTSLSFVTPFAVFLVAQTLHGSGVIAVVLTGLVIAYRAPTVSSAEARVAARLNWRTVEFLLENAVFLYIGLNLATIVRDAVETAPGFWPTVGVCAGVLAALVATRFAWVFATTALYRYGPRRLRERSWSWGVGVAVSAASVRGVVTLAAVFLLPDETPGREFLQFVAFVVVIATLLGGLVLPWIIRRLHLPAPNVEQEITEKRLLTADFRRAGVNRLDEAAGDDDDPRIVAFLRTTSEFYPATLDEFGVEASLPQMESRIRLRHAMLAAERREVLRARTEGRYQEPAIKAALQAIDAEEVALEAQDPRND